MLWQTNVQSQCTKLSITPKLMQAMHILQMSSDELASYIQEQSSENLLMNSEMDSSVIYKGRNRRSAGHPIKDGSDNLMDLVKNPTETLEMALLSQLRINGIREPRYNIVKFLAGSLNDNGFLTIALEEVASHLHVRLQDGEEALKCLQMLEPAGVGARTLQECLQIQIDRDPNADPWAYAIVSRFLNELGSGKWTRIADSLGITFEQIRNSLNYIRTLNPRPGLAFKRHLPRNIKPDAYIFKENDRYSIRLNDIYIPKITINSYYQQLNIESVNKEAKTFLRQNEQSVRWIIESLEQRKATILRVIEAIIQEQFLFLEKGSSYLKPMNLRMVAERLQIHESTVSRAVQNKYVQTPQGLHELKYFFTNGLLTRQGETVSAESIKIIIRDLINEENKKKPLSDQQIADILEKEGIQISRRTVMKYREKLRMLSSRLRVIS